MRFPHRRRLTILCLLSVLVVAGVLCSSAIVRSGYTRGATPASKRVALKKFQTPTATPTPVASPRPNATPFPTPSAPSAPVSQKKSQQTARATGDMSALSVSGSLAGRLLTPSTPSSVNLSARGPADWSHWATSTPASFDHKSGVSQQISNYTLIGTATPSRLADNPTTFSWTDGTPTASATNTPTGIFVSGSGNGFELTVPADESLKTLKLYTGLWASQARLEATLSDGSAPAFVDTSLRNTGGTSNGVYTLTFNAASAGQTLNIKYTVFTDYNAPYGNVTLEAAALVYGEDPNVAPAISIASPGDGATVSASSINLNTNAFDPDGSISKVEFYANAAYIGAGTLTGSDQYNFTWSNAFPGSYSLTAVATDNEGVATTSLPTQITVLGLGSGGSLSGRMLLPPSPNTTNLTTKGTLDWAHWAISSPSSFTHKNAVTPQISNYTRIGTTNADWYANNTSTYSWTDGTPTASATNTALGLFIIGAGNGFELNVPADTTPRTLKLFVGYYAAITRLEATLSDGSAPAFVDTSLGNFSQSGEGTVALTYSAASAGQTLKIRYTVLTESCAQCGNVALKAATLVSGGDPNAQPTVSITSPANNSINIAPANMAISAAAADSNGSINKVEFFQNGVKMGEATTSPYSITWTSSATGVYTLTAVATDNEGARTTSAPVQVQVHAAPLVAAGPDQTITVPASASLYGSVSDDGLPNPPATTTINWSKVSGPGTVTFGNTNAAHTTAAFSSDGTYVLRLTANDGASSVSDDVVITAVSGSVSLKQNPTADAHVRDGANASTNYGSIATLEALNSSTSGETRDAYFKYDVSSVGNVTSAKLRVFAALSVAGSVSTSVYPVSDNTWSETALNWNNKPARGATALNTQTINGTTFGWYEFDVTSFVAGEKAAGRETISLALHNPSVTTPYIKINSREAATNKPELVLVTSETAFVTGKTTGTLRNNLTAFAGMKFTTGSMPVTVTSLGRIFVTGNSGTHAVKLVKASDGTDVAGGSISLVMSAGSATNGFKYAPLAAPLTLAANTSYYLVSQETSGGDQWYDSNTTLTTSPVAVVNSAVSRPSTTWVVAGAANNSFVPVDFKYVVLNPPASATYHLHNDATGSYQLKTLNPDKTSLLIQTANLKSVATGEYLIKQFDSAVGDPNRSGVIPAGSTIAFTMWMKKTGTGGVMLPLVKFYTGNTAPQTLLCSATNTVTPLTTTLNKYALTCQTGSNIVVTPAHRFYLWVGVNLTGASSTNVNGELDIEGTLGGNYDSQVVTPLPFEPTISNISPSAGAVGASVTITGTNFGTTQGSSTLTFNDVPATISSWGPDSITTQVPVGANTGQVVVTVNGVASNPVPFIVRNNDDTDGDGLPDWWELLYFGNLNQDPSGDGDGDGLTNQQEYRQGRNPIKGAVLDLNGLINLRVFTPLAPAQP
jgi:hypothetical protein